LGRPLLYGTTPKFLEHFGFRSLEDLPKPEDLPVILRSRPVDVLTPSQTERSSEEMPVEVMAEIISEDAGSSGEPQITEAAVDEAIEDTMEQATVTVPHSEGDEEERGE
jgi:segregation and condensation protein B